MRSAIMENEADSTPVTDDEERLINASKVNGGFALKSVSFPRVTVADYFALDAASPLKHEFVDGEMFAMAGASERHNTIHNRWRFICQTSHGPRTS